MKIACSIEYFLKLHGIFIYTGANKFIYIYSFHNSEYIIIINFSYNNLEFTVFSKYFDNSISLSQDWYVRVIL